MLTKLKTSVKEILIIYGIGLIITILSAIYFSIKGYPLVTTATETLDIYASPLYMISIFFPYGILIGEVFWLWNVQKERKTGILMFIECIIVGMFSFIRYIINMPFSGHAIIIFFYLLHQAVNRRFTHPSRFLIGIVVLIITVFYKIFLWNDSITFLLGILIGIALWLPGIFYRLKKVRK